MALIDTAFDTVKDALADVTDVASETLETVGAALGDIAEEERSLSKVMGFNKVA